MAQLNKEEIVELINTAWEHMDMGEYEEAEEIAKVLMENEAEAGYPIMASLLALQEQPQEAVELLKKAIEEHPKSWRLKLELGNLYGQLENAAVAMAIFDEALQMPDAEAHWIELNRGIAYMKSNMVDEAMNTLQQIEHPEAINEAFAIQLSILDMLGRHELILAMSKEELNLLQIPEDQEGADTLSNIYSKVAQAFWYEEEENTEAIRYHLRTAIELDRTNEDALWLHREMNLSYSDDAHIYEIMLDGELALSDEEEEARALPFTAVYVVVADTPEDALEMIKDYEIDAIDKSSLQIMEIESMENEEEEPLGLYFTGPLMFGENVEEEGGRDD